MRRPALLVLAVLLPASLRAQTRVLDDFDAPAAWSAHPSDGVELHVRADSGAQGRSMRLDFDFHGGGGYAIVHRDIAIELPANYVFRFRIRGDAPPENLEFKLVDPSGDNVWWDNRRDFHFPREWETLSTKKRQIEFAWGPAGGGEMKRVAAIEISITAGSGGKGTVWLDDLTFTPLPPVTPYDLTPVARASAAAAGSRPALALDGKAATAWRSPAGEQSLTIDFLKQREYGGLVLDWGGGHAVAYEVQTSDDARSWTTAYAAAGANGGRDYVYMPETESRYLRLLLHGSAGGGYALRELTVEPLSFAASPNAFFEAVAKDAPRGTFPRYFLGEQGYWTIVGAPDDTREGLLGTDGALETGRGEFALEPFLWTDGKLTTWADVRTTPSLEDGYLPIPSLRRDAGSRALTVTTFAAGDSGRSTLHARYRVENRGSRPRTVTLFLTARPFQVNPPSQFLNTTGGVAPIGDVACGAPGMTVNGRPVTALTPTAACGAATFDGGGVIASLRQGRLPAATSAHDPHGWGSGALAWTLELAPGQSRDVDVAVPLSASSVPSVLKSPSPSGPDSLLARVAASWRSSLNRVEISLPGAGREVADALRSNLAYILISREGPALHPGTRSYARSWIRDGAMMSAALLRLGHDEEVREYADWYARFQYPNGKVPCCVDARGADPVPENDSNGEFVYLVAEYFRFTGDTATARRLWPNVVRAVAYLDTLRAEEAATPHDSTERAEFAGLLPPSISHEGYSAKPMHSYWDDLWALRGLKDAAYLADVLGHPAEARDFATFRDRFRDDLYASMRASMAAHGIAYIPGAADLGDFDATSTTIGVAPGGELGRLPEPALHDTFEKYWRFFLAREQGDTAWDAYTPYEWRTVGTFVRLGWRERALAALRFFMAGRRPPQWNQWPEVVRHDSVTPAFLGDLPHAWVGSDFIRSALDMLAYVRGGDGALVLGAGLAPEWLKDGDVVVRGLRTEYGPLDLTMHEEEGRLRVRVGGGLRVPTAGIIIRPPLRLPAAEVTVNGEPAAPGAEVVLHRLPAEVVYSGESIR